MGILILDVDNTIISQDYRKLQILKDLCSSNNIIIEEIKQSYNLGNILPKFQIEEEKFWKIFFSAKYQTGEYLKPIPHSILAIQKIADEGHKIIFISGRPVKCEQEKNDFVKTLSDLGYYKKGMEAYIMEVQDSLDNPKKAAELARDFKRKQIEIICKHANEIIVGIGDTPDDISVYSEFNVCPILFKNYFAAEDVIKVNKSLSRIDFLEMNSWHEAPIIMQSLCSSKNVLDQLIQTHIDQYSSYLGELDQKNNIQLAISFFIGTGLFVLWLQPAPKAPFYFQVSIRILNLICLLLTSLSVIYSIRGFSSRHSRGKKSGSCLTTEKFLKSLFLAIKGDRIIFQDNPSWASQEIRKGPDRRRMMAHLAFFQKEFDSLDPAIIRNELLYDLRAMNYQKIYPEHIARTFLLIAIFLSFILLFIYPFSDEISKLFTWLYNCAIQYLILLFS